MPREKFTSRLTGAGFKRGQLDGIERAELMDAFASSGLITDVLGIVDDGKEATVYCCAASPSTGVELLAAKVYRAQRFRAFSKNTQYVGERTHLDARGARALKKRTRRGRAMAHLEWVQWEWEVLCRLCDAGADVPEPFAPSSDAILMAHIGDANGAAPHLRHVELSDPDARAALSRLLENVEILLDNHLVHGDLSAYNVLWWDGRAWVIDLPQAVDVRTHPDAYRLLCRDVENLERYFERYGLDARGVADRAWSRYQRGRLGR
jgi:RIO kinase 1